MAATIHQDINNSTSLSIAIAMWRSLGEAKPRDDAKPRAAATRELPERPPEDALPRPDGSRLQVAVAVGVRMGWVGLEPHLE